MADAAKQLDTRVEIVTPENITFQYRLAGPFCRLPAFLIDLALRIVVFFAAMLAISFVFGVAGLGDVGSGLWLLILFVLGWFYGGLFESLWNGQTPGKRLMGIRVVSVEGQPITPWQAVLRNILRDVDAQPFCLYQIGLLTASLNDRFQRLGDLACGTMVVVEQRRQLQEIVRIDDPEAVRLTSLVPPNFQPSRSLARTLATYVGRRRTLPPTRRQEIARHVGEPLRQLFQLPAETDLDLLLCGVYRRVFLTDRENAVGTNGAQTTALGSPFALTAEIVTATNAEPRSADVEVIVPTSPPQPANPPAAENPANSVGVAVLATKAGSFAASGPMTESAQREAGP